MAHLMPNLIQTFVDSDGAPLVGGKVYFYEAGTSTPLATYQDQGEVTPNANPVILDANGQANIWLKNQAYKIVLADADDSVLITRDNVTHIATGSILTALLADDAVTTVKILNEAVTTAKIDDEAVTRQKIAPDAINGTKIEDDSIDSEHYVDGSIDREHLAADIVNGTKIADDSIDSEHYVDGSIDTGHLADAIVTGPKKAVNYVSATISRTMANSSTATVTTTDSIGALTCYNRPVLVCLYGGTLAFTVGSDTGTGTHRVRVLRNDGVGDTEVAIVALNDNDALTPTYTFGAFTGTPIAPGTPWVFFDPTPGTGTRTYSIESRTTAGGGTTTGLVLTGVLAMVMEL